MIVLVHNKNKVVEIQLTSKSAILDFDRNKQSLNILFDIAKLYPNELIIWVHEDYKSQINLSKIETVFHHKLIMASYAVSGFYSISKRIGYVEQKPYTNISTQVTYPTWIMSSDIGGIHAQVLNQIKGSEIDSDFDYGLSSIAKQGMPKGLFCYSEPSLIGDIKLDKKENKGGSNSQLFKFVSQHYKFIWLVNLVLCYVMFERRIPVIQFVKALFYSKLKWSFELSNIEITSKKEFVINNQVDVIIPTLGRKKCLYDVLKDFSMQTVLPKKVILVEQNPDKTSQSELDYLTTEIWPFKIEHSFIHKTGVCNARNLALSKVTSDWVILGDDDNRFKPDLIESFFNKIKQYGCTVATTTYLTPSEKPSYFYTSQTDIFGSGNTMLKSSLLEKVKFDAGFEYGYGEDSDFGMQLRKEGQDIIFFPDINIIHLKAPIGGFRTEVKQLWGNDNVQPKPSPTMMLFFKKHFNEFQMLGYKFTLFAKFYSKQNIKSPLRYIKKMNAQWENSMSWANKIKNIK